MSVAVEDNVGETFHTSQRVALCDLCPTAFSKWQSAIVLWKIKPLTNEVVVDGYTGQAHVDHLQPWPTNDEPHSDQELEPIQQHQPVADLQTVNGQISRDVYYRSSSRC